MCRRSRWCCSAIRASRVDLTGSPSTRSVTACTYPPPANSTDLFANSSPTSSLRRRGMQSLRRALAKSVGLSAAEFSVLLATSHLQKKRRVGVTAVARHLHVAAAHVTAEIGKLVRKGFIWRVNFWIDHRLHWAEATRSLRRLASAIRRFNASLFDIASKDTRAH